MLSDYIDGNLSVDRAAEFTEHLKTCAYCRHLAESSALTMKRTSSYRKMNTESLSGISPERIEQSKASLIKALRMEPGYGSAVETAAAGRNEEKSRVSLLTRLGALKFSSYASVAAIFIVAVTTLVLYSGSGLVGNIRANFLDKQATTGSVYEDMYGGASNAEGAKDSEMIDGSTDAANNETGSPDVSVADDKFTQPSSISLQSASDAGSSYSYESSSSSPTAMTDRVYFVGQDYSWLDGENETKYITVTGQSLFSSEYSDTLYRYVGIFAYPVDTVNMYLGTFKTIMDTSAVNANIVIIGGENSQKLVEYIGEDESLYMRSKAEANNATLLIISIGR